MKRSARKIPRFHPCPICIENIRYGLGLQRGMRGHFKTVHVDYWKWLRKWMVINTVTSLTVFFSLFPLLIYNIVPSRTATEYTGIGIAIWAAVTFSVMGTGAVHQYRGRGKFKEEWSQNHPPFQRVYGNLRGVEVAVSQVQGRVRSLIGFIIDPITAAALHIMAFFISRRARLSRLDKYEDGRLWLYNGFGQLVVFDVNNPEPRIVDEQRLRIRLRKGQLEVRTENSADIALLVSVLNKAQTTYAVD